MSEPLCGGTESSILAPVCQELNGGLSKLGQRSFHPSDLYKTHLAAHLVNPVRIFVVEDKFLQS